MVLRLLIGLLSGVKARVDRARREHRWERLRRLGMQIGRDVHLPDSTWIDTSHCYLIRIEDHCGFGPECLILAHDAQMDEYLDAARIGRVVVRRSSHVGARCVLLPGIEIGPRTVVGAGSVVSRSLPPDSVCAGNPARVLGSLDEYLQRHRERMGERERFDYDATTLDRLTPELRARMVDAVAESDAYIVGGRSAELAGRGDTPRTGPSSRGGT